MLQNDISLGTQWSSLFVVVKKSNLQICNIGMYINQNACNVYTYIYVENPREYLLPNRSTHLA